jgi:hypothetical protein
MVPTLQEAVAELLRELTGLVQDSREYVQAETRRADEEARLANARRATTMGRGQ